MVRENIQAGHDPTLHLVNRDRSASGCPPAHELSHGYIASPDREISVFAPCRVLSIEKLIG